MFLHILHMPAGSSNFGVIDHHWESDGSYECFLLEYRVFTNFWSLLDISGERSWLGTWNSSFKQNEDPLHAIHPIYHQLVMSPHFGIMWFSQVTFLVWVILIQRWVFFKCFISIIIIILQHCLACRISVPGPGMEPMLLQWKWGVLTTGPLGKSPEMDFDRLGAARDPVCECMWIVATPGNCVWNKWVTRSRGTRKDREGTQVEMEGLRCLGGREG